MAIKRLRREILADPQRGRLLRQLFINERRPRSPALAHSAHRRGIHDALVTDEDAWLVMDHVRAARRGHRDAG